MSMYLARLLEVLGAKRTRSEEKQDKSTLKRLMEEKAAKDAARQSKNKPVQEVQAPADKQKEKTEKNVAKIKNMATPCLFLINSNLTAQHDDAEEAKAKYQEFLDEDAVKDLLKSSVNLSNTGRIHSWIVDEKSMETLKFEAFHVGLMHSPLDKPANPLPANLEDPELFKSMEIDLEGVNTPSKLKKDLNTNWASLAAKFAEEPKEKKPETPKEKEKEKEPETPKESKEPEDSIIPDSDTPEEKEGEPEELFDESPEEQEAPAVDVGKFKSLKDPYIFILDPRKSASGEGGIAEYQNFLGPDEEGAKKRSSAVLAAKAIKFWASRRLRSAQPENLPVLVYFLNGSDVKELMVDLKRERPHYQLGPFDKKLLDEDEPFTKLTINNAAVNDVLTTEMNRAWLTATSETSGNPFPAIQANTSIPLDFFRFVSKKQRPVHIYIGGRPAGSGAENSIYVLTKNKHEADAFVALMARFKMSSLFYERLSGWPDIDSGFKAIDPEVLTPANVLVLFGKEAFNPKAPVEITEDNREWIESISSDPKKTTQLDVLHAFAKQELKNKTLKPGAFIKSKAMIGDHVLQFNANMTICFVWGSLSQHVPLNPNDVLKMLPFVKTVNTNYL